MVKKLILASFNNRESEKNNLKIMLFVYLVDKKEGLKPTSLFEHL